MSESRRTPWAKWLFLTIQVLIACGLAWWIFRRPGFIAGFTDAWKNIHPLWLVAALLVAGLSLATHVWRWWICLRLLGISVRWWRLCGVFMASTFIGTFVIGGIGGDASRILMLKRDFPGQGSRLMVSVIADRLCGLISLALPALIFTLPANDILSHTPVGKAALHFLWGYLVFATLLFGFCYFCGTEKARRWLPPWVPAREWMLHVSECFELLRPTRFKLLSAVAASVLMLALHFGTFWCIARGCRAGVSLPQINAVLPVIEAATTVPATPGGIGMREELFRDQLASIAGTPAGPAVMISIAGFLCGLLWSVLGGIAAATLLPRSFIPAKDANSAA